MKMKESPAKVTAKSDGKLDNKAAKNGHSPRKMNPTKNQLSPEVREQMIGLLNARLADILDLLTQTKHAHWNVKGINFIALHELFDELAGVLYEHTDSIAERAVMLGGQAYGTARSSAAASTLSEYPLDISYGQEHVQALSSQLAFFGQKLREGQDEANEADDQDTVDLFTDVSRDVDKYLWFVEAHLQNSDNPLK